MKRQKPGPRSRAARKALASTVRAILRSVEGARDPQRLEVLRVALARRRKRAVTLEDAQRFAERVLSRWRAQVAARSVTMRQRVALGGLCTRCRTNPARPGENRRTRLPFTTCEDCNEGAKARMRGGRAAEKARKVTSPAGKVLLQQTPTTGQKETTLNDNH